MNKHDNVSIRIPTSKRLRVLLVAFFVVKILIDFTRLFFDKSHFVAFALLILFPIVGICYIIQVLREREVIPRLLVVLSILGICLFVALAYFEYYRDFIGGAAF